MDSNFMTGKLLIKVGDGWIDSKLLNQLKQTYTMEELEILANGRTIRTAGELGT